MTMQVNLRTLGPNEAQVVLSLRLENQDIVQASEIIDILGSEPKARKVIRNLVRKGWLSRLMPGRYMFLPPEHGPENLGENNVLALASAVVKPSYVSWWRAASFHGFTTQKPMSVAVASLRQAPTQVIEDTEVRFVKLAERKFFGFTTYNLHGREVTLSTAAKTVVDCVDRPDLAGGPAEVARIVAGAATSVDARELISTALRMKSKALWQRLGFLADLVGWHWPEEIRNELRAAIPKSQRSVFGTAHRRPDDIGYVSDWGLFVNMSEKDLLADVPQVRHDRTS
jgi:predicted transcriptional regulator of viral defense system